MYEQYFHDLMNVVKQAAVTTRPPNTPILVIRKIFDDNKDRLCGIPTSDFFSFMKEYIKDVDLYSKEPNDLDCTERIQLAVAVCCLQYTELLNIKSANLPGAYDFESWSDWFAKSTEYPPRRPRPKK